jgi:serine phosphatase RsbU (regulator of sigma subunit)
MPIGIFELEDKDFVSQTIPAKPGDIIYMFSDGYIDQFGGPDRKRYKYKTFKAFLLKIHTLPLQEQKEMLEKEFFGWKGDNIQLDDVLILGMRIE